MAQGNKYKDTFKILVTTDQHVGFMENDPIRGEDSFRTLDEIFRLAVQHEVDFVLMGGDLFHDNKPSRRTMYKTMQIFRKYCLGDRPTAIQVVSDNSINFPDTNEVNYEDSNYNISLPVFAIHGNHDDPAGAGGYSAMDLLSSARLVNYFGKVDRNDLINNYPILMKKGISKMALYGMGNVRDERLHRTFKSHQVKFIRPSEDIDEWFNVAILHQNRTKHSNIQKNYIGDTMLPRWLDLVLWGHEHEQQVKTEESATSGFPISQPGSSIATSLCYGESVKKMVGLLEINGDLYRMKALPLKTVRPFYIEDFRLADVAGLQNSLVAEALKDKIHSMIVQSSIDNPIPADEDPNTSRYRPLIRLRVDYTGFDKIDNIQRFGQEFVGKVANTDDLLSFFKQKVVNRGGRGEDDERGRDWISLGAAGGGGEDDDDEGVSIYQLISQHLGPENALKILSEVKLREALTQFVDKDEIHAVDIATTACVKSMLHLMSQDKAAAGMDKNKMEQFVASRHELLEASERAEAEKKAKAKAKAPKESAAVSKRNSLKEERQNAVDDDGEMAMEEELRASSKQTATSSKAATSKHTTKAESEEEEEKSMEMDGSDSDLEVKPKMSIIESWLSQPKPKTVSGKGSKAAPTKKKATPVKATKAASKRKVIEIDDDESEEEISSKKARVGSGSSTSLKAGKASKQIDSPAGNTRVRRGVPRVNYKAANGGSDDEEETTSDVSLGDEVEEEEEEDAISENSEEEEPVAKKRGRGPAKKKAGKETATTSFSSKRGAAAKQLESQRASAIELDLDEDEDEDNSIAAKLAAKKGKGRGR